MVVPYQLTVNIVMFALKLLRVSKYHAVRDISRSHRLVQWNIYGDQLGFVELGRNILTSQIPRTLLTQG